MKQIKLQEKKTKTHTNPKSKYATSKNETKKQTNKTKKKQIFPMTPKYFQSKKNIENKKQCNVIVRFFL